MNHREYVLDRARKIQRLFTELEQSESLRASFHEDPQAMGTKYGLTFDDEEIFGIKSARQVDLANLKERLAIHPVAFFDANCSCKMFGTPGIIQER
jgi:hypothetical protein